MTEYRAAHGSPDVDALRDEIRQTRAELGQTVQALAAKADVKARVKESAGQAVVWARGSLIEAGRSARRRPAPWLAVAGGAAAIAAFLIIWKGRR